MRGTSQQIGRNSLRKVLQERPEGCLVLHHYGASETHARHYHDHVQVSFVLAGSMFESIGHKTHELTVSAACIKLAGTDHADAWGDKGVLILSLRLWDWQMGSDLSAVTDTWTPVDIRSLRPVVRAALSNAADDDQSSWSDLLSLIPSTTPEAPSPPAWLARIREALADDPSLSVAELASTAGVHRVHLSRTFTHHVGTPLSVFRKQAMLARAIEGSLRSADSLAQVAQLAGFADQSHMNREIVAAFGITPKALRNGFARFDD